MRHQAELRAEYDILMTREGGKQEARGGIPDSGCLVVRSSNYALAIRAELSAAHPILMTGRG